MLPSTFPVNVKLTRPGVDLQYSDLPFTHARLLLRAALVLYVCTLVMHIFLLTENLAASYFTWTVHFQQGLVCFMKCSPQALYFCSQTVTRRDDENTVILAVKEKFTFSFHPYPPIQLPPPPPLTVEGQDRPRHLSWCCPLIYTLVEAH